MAHRDNEPGRKRPGDRSYCWRGVCAVLVAGRTAACVREPQAGQLGHLHGRQRWKRRDPRHLVGRRRAAPVVVARRLEDRVCDPGRRPQGCRYRRLERDGPCDQRDELLGNAGLAACYRPNRPSYGTAARVGRAPHHLCGRYRERQRSSGCQRSRSRLIVWTGDGRVTACQSWLLRRGGRRHLHTGRAGRSFERPADGDGCWSARRSDRGPRDDPQHDSGSDGR